LPWKTIVRSARLRSDDKLSWTSPRGRRPSNGKSFNAAVDCAEAELALYERLERVHESLVAEPNRSGAQLSRTGTRQAGASLWGA